MTLAALYPSEIIGESFRLRKCTNGATALAGQARQNLSGNRIQSRHLPKPRHPFVGDNATKGNSVSQTPHSREFRERISDALRRRLHPNTNLRAKVLAHAIGTSEATIWNLLSRNTDASGRVLDSLIRFFRDGFINEVFGCHNIHCIDTRADKKAAALRRMIEAQDELRRLG